jgi:hypothetical protein
LLVRSEECCPSTASSSSRRKPYIYGISIKRSVLLQINLSSETVKHPNDRRSNRVAKWMYMVNQRGRSGSAESKTLSGCEIRRSEGEIANTVQTNNLNRIFCCLVEYAFPFRVLFISVDCVTSPRRFMCTKTVSVK